MILPSADLIVEYNHSSDYKKRIIGEYWFIKEKYEKLRLMLVKREAGTLDFEPVCPVDSWINQLSAQAAYLHELEIRAEYEEIDLDSILYPRQTETEWNLE